MTIHRHPRHPGDQADVVARALLRIVADHLVESWTDGLPALHARVRDYLRDELRDAARQAADEIRLRDE